MANFWFNIIIKESPELNINLLYSPPVSHSSFSQCGLALLSNYVVGLADLRCKTEKHTFVLNENLNSQKWGLFWELLRWAKGSLYPSHVRFSSILDLKNWELHS